jgi:OmpA-OmpF porin, OOP family
MSRRKPKPLHGLLFAMIFIIMEHQKMKRKKGLTMKKPVLIMNILLILSLCSSFAFAQVKPGTLSVTPYVGGFIFDKEQNLNSAPLYGLRLGYDFTRYLGVEASGNFIATQYDRTLANVDQGSSGLNYRLEGIAHLLPQYRLTPFVAAGVGGQTLNYPRGVQNTTAFVADYGGGVKYFLTDRLALRADIRHLYVFDNAKKDIEYGIGLSFLFGGAKAAPGPSPEPLYSPLGLSAKGVSESQSNLLWKEVPGATGYRIYRDGAYLTASASPLLSDAGLKADTRYCYMVTAVDKDGKESARSDQACASTLAPATPPPSAPADIAATAVSESQINVLWKESAGATSYKIYRDGTYLTASRTPALSDLGLKADNRYCYAVSAVNAAGRESEKGKEACATTPASLQEQKRTAESAATAALQKEMLEKGRAVIDIEFDYDKAVVKRHYHQELKKFADVIQANPALHVVIEGHTDNVGSRDYNMKLSLKRAESVRVYLVKQFGVKAIRLTSKGYGMSKPIAGNQTAEGRMKNRRVEAAIDYTINNKQAK